MADSEDEAVVKAVTANPNTPTEVILELGSRFPEELLSNPVFDLLLLANLNLLAEMPRNTLESLLKCPCVPTSFLQWALNHKGIDG